MIRLLIVVLVLLALPLTEAAERLSARLSQRLFVIMDRASDDPAAALEDLRRLLESRSMSPAEKGYIAYERIGLLIQQDQSESALQELEALRSDDSITFIPRLRRLYAQLLLMNDQPEPALEQLEIWSREAEDPQPAELVLMGYTYLQLERFAEGAQVLERSIAMTENPPPQWSELLAYAYTRSGRANNAIELLKNLIAEQPDQAGWWRQLASIFLLIEDTPRGTAGLVIASHLEELSFDEIRRLAGLFTSLGMPADAAMLFSRAMAERLDQDPQSVSFDDHMLLGEMWMLARELDLAVASFARAAQLEPTSEPYLKTAQLYLQWERYGEARESLLQALRLAAESERGQISYLLAVTEINLNNLQAASDLLLRLKNNPAYAERAQRLDSFVSNRLAEPLNR